MATAISSLLLSVCDDKGVLTEEWIGLLCLFCDELYLLKPSKRDTPNLLRGMALLSWNWTNQCHLITFNPFLDTNLWYSSVLLEGKKNAWHLCSLRQPCDISHLSSWPYPQVALSLCKGDLSIWNKLSKFHLQDQLLTFVLLCILVYCKSLNCIEY